jgi:hypothetical protein
MLNYAFLQDIIDSNIKAVKTNQEDLTRNAEILIEYFNRYHNTDTATTVLELITGKYKPSVDSQLSEVAVFHPESGSICVGFVEFFSPIDKTYKIRFMVPETFKMYYATEEDKANNVNGSRARYDKDNKRYEYSQELYDTIECRPRYETIELSSLVDNAMNLSTHRADFINNCHSNKWSLRPVYDIDELKTAVREWTQEQIAKSH